MMSSIYDFLSRFAWPLIWFSLALTLIDAFDDHSETTKQLKESKGFKKCWLHAKRVRLWTLPLILGVGAILAQIGSGIDENKITKLESQNAPRTLTPEQSAGITTALRGNDSLKPMICFQLDSLSEDSQQYGNAIARALANAGFIINPNASSISAGLGRDVTVGPSTSPAASAITSALNQNGVRATIQTGGEVLMGNIAPTPPGALTISIGKKSIEIQ